jgi:hypothetical protein
MGKTVAARLTVRLDYSPPGQALDADVEATDTPGSPTARARASPIVQGV